MTSRPYPEAIRGAWYMMRQDDSIDKARERDTYELYIYRLDGTFSRIQLKDGHVKSQEQGDFTFDGEFLITRGRNTETYRVDAKSPREWHIETKKHAFVIRRSLYASDDAVLSSSDSRDIRILPIRVKVAFPNDALGTSHGLLTFDRGGELQKPLILGEIAVELQPDHKLCWIGLTKRADGIEPQTWDRILRESVFDLGLEETDGIEELELLDIEADRFNVVELG